MNINDLTIGQVKELTSLIGVGGQQNIPSPNIGKYCIIRCRDAGVHAGIVVLVHGRTVHLKESRRLYRYWAASEHTLSAVSQLGLNSNGKSQLARQLNDVIELGDMCEVLPCSEVAEKSIRQWTVYNEQ